MMSRFRAIGFVLIVFALAAYFLRFEFWGGFLVLAVMLEVVGWVLVLGRGASRRNLDRVAVDSSKDSP